MATTRSAGYVVTAAVWNAVLSRLTDDGNTYSGAFNGSSVTGTTGSFSSTLAVTGATTLTGHLRANGNIGIATAESVARLNIPIGGASAETGDYGRGIQITGPGTNFGQMLAMVRSGLRVWSIGYAYNTSTLAIGNGQTTDSNFTAAAAALTITTAGEVQAPMQPGFLAYNSASDTSVTNGTTVDFDTEVYDDGGDFSSDTFTAPVAGRYLLCGAIYLTNTAGAVNTVQASVVTSNRTYVGARMFEVANSGVVCLPFSVVADMDASDTASVRIDMSTGTVTISSFATPEARTYFSGRLLP